MSGRVQCGLRELVPQSTHEGGERRKTISKGEEPSRFQWVPRGCYDDDDPSPLRARENHGGRYKGSEAASRGRGEREEQESDGVQDTGWGHAKGQGVGASNQCCDDANRAHDEHVHVRSDRTGVTTGGPAHNPSQG